MKFLACLVFVFLSASVVFPCVVDVSNIKTNAVYGRVIAETKEAIRNAQIQIFKNSDNGVEILAETKTDENGRFEIKNFPPGKYLIRARTDYSAESLAEMRLKKSSSNVKKKEIVFTLFPALSCRGLVEMQKIQNTK